jgi:hypothetical protein
VLIEACCWLGLRLWKELGDGTWESSETSATAATEAIWEAVVMSSGICHGGCMGDMSLAAAESAMVGLVEKVVAGSVVTVFEGPAAETA